METSRIPGARRRRHAVVRRAALAHRRASRLPPTLRGLMWSIAAGILFVLLNTLMRRLALQLDAFQTQFLRYLAGLGVLLPLLVRGGLAAYRPRSIAGQFTRGAVHTLGLCLWFIAIAHISLADTTAIGFTTPIFVMIGAALVLHEPMRAERWIAAGLGLAGVLLVVGPQLSGAGGIYTLVMLATCPVFAASFLFTKALTRYERPEVIVMWQAITVTLFSLPLATISPDQVTTTLGARFLDRRLTVSVRWQAVAGPTDLHYRVRFSPDGGKHWTVLALDTPALSIVVPAELLASAASPIVEVQGSDGVRVDEAVIMLAAP